MFTLFPILQFRPTNTVLVVLNSGQDRCHHNIILNRCWTLIWNKTDLSQYSSLYADAHISRGKQKINFPLLHPNTKWLFSMKVKFLEIKLECTHWETLINLEFTPQQLSKDESLELCLNKISLLGNGRGSCSTGLNSSTISHWNK